MSNPQTQLQTTTTSGPPARVTFKERINTMRDLLTKMKPQLALALPKHLNPDRMTRIVLTSVQRVPELLDCDPTSFAGAVIQAAQLGLEPDGVLGYAYLIPFKNSAKQITECQLMIGYRGMLHLARQSGQISSISVDTVHEHDVWEYERGLTEKLRHVPSEEADPGELVRAYAIARFKDGGHQIEVMSKSQIDAIRTRSKAGSSGPWVTDYLMMARKTVLKRLCKYLPASVEKDTALSLDDRGEAGVSQEMGDMVDVTASAPHPELPAAGESAVTSEAPTSVADIKATAAANAAKRKAGKPPVNEDADTVEGA